MPNMANYEVELLKTICHLNIVLTLTSSDNFQIKKEALTLVKKKIKL